MQLIYNDTSYILSITYQVRKLLGMKPIIHQVQKLLGMNPLKFCKLLMDDQISSIFEKLFYW
ncbi:hypothetical protein ACF0H5_016022 [Mactra antiquata]